MTTNHSTDAHQIVAHNLHWYTRHQTFREPMFWGPILVVSHAKLAGMQLDQIFYSEVVALLIIVLLNIRMGIWADKVGHLKVMKVGEVLLFTSFIGFVCMSTIWHAWVANCLWAIGFACMDGSDHSFLHENLKLAGREHEHNHQNIATTRYRFLITCFTSLVTGFLAEIHMRLPLVISVIPMSYSLFAMWKLKDVVTYAREETCVETKSHTSKVIFTEAFATVKQSRLIVWVIIFFVLTSVISKIWFFTYNNYYAFVGIPVWMYGIIFTCINIGTYMTVVLAKKIVPEGQELKRAVMIAIIVAVCPLAQGWFPCFALAFLPVFQTFSRTLVRSIVSHVIHNEAKSTSRATAQSIASSIKDVFAMVALMCSGLIMSTYSVTTLLTILGGLGCIGALVLWYLYFRYRKRSDTHL